MTTPYRLAIDIGASSGRHILGRLQNGRIVLEEVYRFETPQLKSGGRLKWDIPAMLNHVISGLNRCAKMGMLPVTLGVDTWGVDFVLTDGCGNTLGDSCAYRDKRTEGMDAEISKLIPEEALYARTGIKRQIFNTIYQLAAVKNETPELLSQADRLMMIPEFLNYLLTGNAVSEYTIATTTGLLDAKSRTWDAELLNMLEYPTALFGELHMPGTIVGGFTDEIRERTGFDCTVVLPPSHDTGSAFLAIPVFSDTSVCISSGTWSLLGVETDGPILTEAARAAGFTNEGAYASKTRFIKNIMGLWLIQSIRREMGGSFSFPELMELAGSSGYQGIVDVNDEAFLAPDSTIETVKQKCSEGGYRPPITSGDVVKCVYNSLATAYAQSIRQLETHTGRRYTGIHIIGGGCKDMYLNKLTARMTGLPVFAGPVEGSALGNIVSQMIAAGEISGVDEARAIIRDSFAVSEVAP